MNFSAEHIRLIYQNTKTQFRVPKLTERCGLRTERVYTVDGTTSDANPHGLQITVTDIREERLGDITLEDAVREGHRTVSGFLAAWRLANADNRLDPNCEGTDLPVWVMTFKRGDWTDRPHLLAARFGRSDYTDNPALAIRDEPEAISDAEADLYAVLSSAGVDADTRRRVSAARDRVARELSGLRRAATGDRYLETTVRRLERELGVLDRKLKMAA